MKWRKKENTNSKSQIECTKKQIASMHEEGGQKDWDRWYQLRTTLDEANKVEEEFWARKSRIEWLQEGNKNTKFFMPLQLKGEREIELIRWKS